MRWGFSGIIVYFSISVYFRRLWVFLSIGGSFLRRRVGLFSRGLGRGKRFVGFRKRSWRGRGREVTYARMRSFVFRRGFIRFFLEKTLTVIG